MRVEIRVYKRGILYVYRPYNIITLFVIVTYSVPLLDYEYKFEKFLFSLSERRSMSCEILTGTLKSEIRKLATSLIRQSNVYSLILTRYYLLLKYLTRCDDDDIYIVRVFTYNSVLQL